MLFMGQTVYSKYQTNGHYCRINAFNPDVAFLQMEPRRLRFFQEKPLMETEEEYLELFREISGLSRKELKALQDLFSLDLNDTDVKHFLRLYNLIPTREQHEMALKLQEMGVPLVCIDQNPLLVFTRYHSMDKMALIHTLFNDKEKDLTARLKDLKDAQQDSIKYMKSCRNSVYNSAVQKWDSLKRLGINYYFDDAVTKEDIMMFNISMQFNMTSYYKSFYYPRVFDTVRQIDTYVEAEDKPKKYICLLGIMNMYNVKDMLLLHSDFWVNELKDQSMERDGSIIDCVSPSVPSCDYDKIKEINEKMKNCEYRLNLTDIDH